MLEEASVLHCSSYYWLRTCWYHDEKVGILAIPEVPPLRGIVEINTEQTNSMTPSDPTPASALRLAAVT
jgi:hypothetical protein